MVNHAAINIGIGATTQWPFIWVPLICCVMYIVSCLLCFFRVVLNYVNENNYKKVLLRGRLPRATPARGLCLIFDFFVTVSTGKYTLISIC